MVILSSDGELTIVASFQHGYTLRRRANRGGCSSPRGMEWRASEPPSALMAKAQPASFLAGYALEKWWSGSWLGRGSNITELLVRTLDNTQSVIGKVPNVNMLNLPNLCPRSEILEVLPSARPMPQETLEEPPMTRIPKMLTGPRETPNGESGVNQQQRCDEGLR